MRNAPPRYMDVFYSLADILPRACPESHGLLVC